MIVTFAFIRQPLFLVCQDEAKQPKKNKSKGFHTEIFLQTFQTVRKSHINISEDVWQLHASTAEHAYYVDKRENKK